MPQEKKEEKMIVDRLRPSEELREVGKVDVKMEERVLVSELAADMLKEESIKYVFYLGGGQTHIFLVPFQKAGIPCVQVRHEQTAGFAMDAWGRLTRRPGFALIGNGTGGTNFSSGLAQAYSAGAPGVVLQSDSGTMDDDKYGGQGIFRTDKQFDGMAKFARRVTNTANILWQLKRAFRTSVTPPSGPCVVGYTGDYGETCFTTRRQAYGNYTPGFWKPNEKVLQTQGNPGLVQQLVDWLLGAERPAIIAGHAAQQDDCQDEFRELAHMLGIPSSGRRVARGIISEVDPICYGRRARGPVMAQADRIILLGLRVGFLEGWGRAPFFPHSARYAQVQSCREHVDLVLPTEIEVIGNLKMILRQMIDCIKSKGINKPLEKWAKWREFVTVTEESYRKRTMARTDQMMTQMPIHPDLVGRLSAEVLSEDYHNDYIAIIDGFTASAYFTAWNVAVNTGQVLDASETIGIGHSPGMALAAGLATNREKPILGLMGDGAVGAGGMDIETCARWDIPAVFLHENNNTLINGQWEYFWAGVAHPTNDVLKDSAQTIHNIHFEKVFAEMGCHPEFVERPEQIKPALKRAFAFAMKNKKPAFVECFVDMDVVHSMFASPGMAAMNAALVRWNELPEKGKKFVAVDAFSPLALSMMPQDWKDGIAAYQKK